MKALLPANYPASRRSSAAFSLLEMLVGMGVLSIIVLALFAMFDQTQKALLANVGQSDVMESGRSVVDLLGRDVLRARPANLDTNYVYDPGTALVKNVVPPSTNLMVLRTGAGLPAGPARQALLDGWRRDTLLHELFYLAEVQPGEWTGAGLFVAAEEDPRFRTNGIGSLFRYEDPRHVNLRGSRASENAGALSDRFFRENGLDTINYRTNASRLVDGVVYFRATAFGPNGEALDPTFWRAKVPPQSYPGILLTSFGRTNLSVPVTRFEGRAFPSALELELGVLPAELLEKYRALPETPPGVRERFLNNNLANVLVFRQRLPMPTTSPVLP